jgi:hypothetical protein
LDDPIQRQGIYIKRQWLLEFLKKYGSCTKIAYLNDKPVAQVLFYPEESIPSVKDPRKDALILHCIYNPFDEARGRGVASALIRSLVNDCKMGHTCFKGKPCTFICTRPFDTHEDRSLSKFYTSKGFKHANNEMFLEISSSYKPRKTAEVPSLNEDKGRAIVFYNPVCEWSFPFALRIKDLLSEVSPSLPVHIIDEWRSPEESSKRGNEQLIINAKPIRSFFTQREKFIREVKKALKE